MIVDIVNNARSWHLDKLRINNNKLYVMRFKHKQFTHNYPSGSSTIWLFLEVVHSLSHLVYRENTNYNVFRNAGVDYNTVV